jgi:uncharacterized membrane protein YhhN
MNLFKKHGFAIFWLFATADLLLIVLDVEKYRIYTKSLLMPLLLLTIFSRVNSHRHTTSKIIVALALVLATAGDILLLNSSTPAYFIGGLVSFLVMQLLYSIYFLRVQKLTTKHFSTPFITLLVVGALAAAVIMLLWNHLGEYRMPLIVYAAFLGFMCITAVNAVHYRITNKLALEAFIPGAILFFISDFILAANMFYLKEAFIGIAVMATYCGAQYYLARGFVKHLK